MIPIADERDTRGFQFLTILIIILNVTFFLFSITGNFQRIVREYGFIPAQYELSDTESVFNIFSSMFLHGSVLHIAGNMLFLYVFGDDVEERLGKIGFLIFYFVSGIVATFAQFLINPASSIPMIGASGAISGILGFYLVNFPKSRVRILLLRYGGTAYVSAGYMLLEWFIFQLISSVGALGSYTGGVAYLAHVGGFVVGLLVGYISKEQRR